MAKDPTYTVHDFSGSLAWIHERMGRPVRVSLRAWPSEWTSMEATGYLSAASDLGQIPGIGTFRARDAAMLFVLGYTQEPSDEEVIAQIVLEPSFFLEGASRKNGDTIELNLKFDGHDIRFVANS